MEYKTHENSHIGHPLIDCIYILGLSPRTLRNMYLENTYTSAPEIIIQLPTSQSLSNHILKAIFHPFHISLHSSPQFPSFFSTSCTDSYDKTEYFHCLRIWEKITPTVLEKTKERRSPSGYMSFIENPYDAPEEPETNLYTEIVICIKTLTKYIDLFRKILKNFYSFLYSFEGEWDNCLISVEFMKMATFLLNDLQVPDKGMRMSFAIGRQTLEIPQETDENVGNYECCIGILLDLVDIKNILAIWECLLLGQSVVFMSSNEYNVYLIIQAFIQLLFPFKATQYCIPIIDAEDLTQILPNKPLLVGMKAGELDIKDLKYIDPELSYLNIDSNSLFLAKDSKLCDCLRTKLGQKIQYLKSFYYVDPERLNVYRMTSLEKAIKDTDFFKKVKVLAEARSQKPKDRYFVELIRKLFFSVFSENFSDFPKLVVEQSFSGTEFQRDLFLQKIQKCGKCSLEDFWNDFFASKNFHEFLESYEKKEPNPERFLRICGNSNGNKVMYKNDEVIMKIVPHLSTKGLFKRLLFNFNKLTKDSVSKRFTVETAFELLKDYQKQIGEGEGQQGVKKHKIFQSLLEKRYFSRQKFAFLNIFYGDFCILQFVKGLVQPIGDKLKEFSSECENLADNEMPLSRSNENLNVE